MDTLVTTDWLSEHLDDTNLVVLDCSVYSRPTDDGGIVNVSGCAEYEAGHIPTAGFADLIGDLSDGSSGIEFAVPAPERFCSAMAALGVRDDSKVVLYDGFLSAWAARVWWMLRWVGFDRAAILDGGLQAWTAEGRPLSSKAATRPIGHLTPAPRPDLIAGRDEVTSAMDDEAVCLIDSMPGSHYRGEETMFARPGHIPGASNASFLDLLTESGHFRPLAELAEVFEGDRDARTITYCGGGIAASATAFVMSRLGFSDVAVYTASLQEWAADPANPLVVGAA